MTIIRESNKMALLGVSFGFAVFPCSLEAQVDLVETRETLHQWIETEAKIEKADSEWDEDKKTLDDIIDILKSEISTLEEKLEKSREEISKADAKREKLGKDRTKLKKASGTIQKVIAKLEKQVHELYILFPQPLKTTIDPLYARIPKPGEETEASLSARMQNVVGILTQADKFNGGIKLDPSLRKLEDGRTVEIKTLYLGLGYAYFIDNLGTYAGVGVPGESGWEWEEKPDLAATIADAVEVYEDPQKANFVLLPVEIK